MTKVLKEPISSAPIGSGQAFIALMGARNTEAHLRWSGVQLVIALNLPAIVTVLYRITAKPNPVELATLLFGCAAATILALFWYHVLRRDGRLLNFWNESLQNLEASNEIEGRIKVFTSERYVKLNASQLRLQHRLEIFTRYIIAGWILLGACCMMLLIVQ